MEPRDIENTIAERDFREQEMPNNEPKLSEEIKDELLKYYEANILDGESITDCGKCMGDVEDIFTEMSNFITKKLAEKQWYFDTYMKDFAEQAKKELSEKDKEIAELKRNQVIIVKDKPRYEEAK